MPLSPLQATPRDVACKTEGQDVGLSHSLQHAGLSRRTLANALTVHVDFQASDYATNLGP
jgi:hypothetical protein